jgi:DNA-directed RNA polymerase subunit RPC12/RpoP
LRLRLKQGCENQVLKVGFKRSEKTVALNWSCQHCSKKVLLENRLFKNKIMWLNGIENVKA